MRPAATIRIQVESALAHKFPSALTPPARMIHRVIPTGIDALDSVLGGGFPVGAITELVGGDCSGRTSVALSFLSRITAADSVCAWIDASNTFHPASAGSVGVDLARLLWVRCGVKESAVKRDAKQFLLPAACFAPKPVKKGLHGGGHGTHPRSEMKGLSAAVDRFLNHEAGIARCAEPVVKPRPTPESFESSLVSTSTTMRTPRRARVYDAIEQAIRSADLLLLTGGFGAIVVDLGGIEPVQVARIELSTWHRYRAASEQAQSSLVLLSQYPCAKSSSELQLRLRPMEASREERTVFTGLDARVEVQRRRFTEIATNVVPMRKPPQRRSEACWSQPTSWVGLP